MYYLGTYLEKLFQFLNLVSNKLNVGSWVLLALSFIFLAKPILKMKFALYLILSLWVSRQCGLGNANRLKMVDHATSCLSCNESFEFGEVAARQKDELRRIVVEWSIGLCYTLL